MMEHDFATAAERVSRLVADFRQHERAYLSQSYSEQDVRKDFIDKFWTALGWDVNHERQKNPNEREVKVESNVRVEGRRKKADYAFLASNFRDVRFFVEAKKPARNIDNADDYFQTIRYGWNASAPLSILTDFEQFRVLDCRYKPDIQTALNRAIPKLKLHYTEYADEERFAEIYYLFSREAVRAGKLEAFAASLEKPAGKAAQRRLYGGAYKSVDEDFLRELDELRDELARVFKIRNQHLDGEALTEATQRTLDRLVFMRFLEDKLIEPETIVERLGTRGPAWSDFVVESERLNKIYNGIIFKPHFIDRADFVFDEHVFASVRERLSHENSPYDFNSLPVHILGSIYERFLGKVIVTTDKRARVEEKPEVRKAGGVYYTPAYIVRYLVERSVGALVKGKSPEEIATMRFADIACGSGSFLLGVYDELLRHHTAYYNEPKNRRKAIKAGGIENADGSIRLSLNQRKDILLNNIYGVDLDAQAVEVAQLSLFLKLLEDETTASARGFQLEFRETMLPSLDKNVVHGNSLINWDISGDLFGDEEEKKLFPMDFEQAFPEVMRRGGFDAIVGNPPYVFARDKGFSTHEKKYFNQKYKHNAYQINSFLLFTEQGFNLLKDDGRLGFIIPNNWLSISTMKIFRDFIIGSTADVHIVNNKHKVFSGANVDTSLLLFKKAHPDFVHLSESTSPNEFTDEVKVTANRVLSSPLIQMRIYGNSESESILNKIESNSVPLSQVALVKAGLKAYETGKGNPPQTDSMKKSRVYHSTQRLATDDRIYLDGKDVKRYELGWSGEYLKYGENLAAPRDPKLFEGTRILVRQIPSRPPYSINAMIVSGEELNDINSMIIKLTSELYSEKYILGVLNSKLMTFWFDRKFDKFQRGIFPQFKVNELATFPIRTVNFSDPTARARHDRLVNLVEQTLASKRGLQQAHTDRDRHFYESKCAALDRQLDQLVYELYELTTEEISLLEDSRD